MQNTSPEVDRYIANAAPFARPILERIRKAFHKAGPEVVETMKWSVPHFEYKGVLGSMAAFKQHVGWGFWKASLMSDPHGILALRGKHEAMGGARVEDVKDMPSERILVAYVREAIRLNEEGAKVSRPPRAQRAEPEVPADLAAALKKSPAAKKAFEKFPPSHRREYVEWITDAKREATRQKRIETAVALIEEGKNLNWKYERK